MSGKNKPFYGDVSHFDKINKLPPVPKAAATVGLALAMTVTCPIWMPIMFVKSALNGFEDDR